MQINLVQYKNGYWEQQYKIEDFQKQNIRITKNQQARHMDLDYPSQKKNQLSDQLNRMDRRYGSIILSNPVLPSMTPKAIPSKIRKKLVNYIHKDMGVQLIRLLDRESIGLNDQIKMSDRDGICYSVLHYVAQCNSVGCMDCCMRWAFQMDRGQYETVVNYKNNQGDTPLITCSIYKSTQTLKQMLQYGGIDIYHLNKKKLTAYQLALTSGSEQILQMLMKYQLKIKKNKFINYEGLSREIQGLRDSEQKQKMGLGRFCQCFLECFYFGKSGVSQIVENKGEENGDTQTNRRMVHKLQTNNELQNIQIYWQQLHKTSRKTNKKLPLFSSISHPFAIKQSSIIVSHLFILFQALAEHPEMLKRIIYSTDLSSSSGSSDGEDGMWGSKKRTKNGQSETVKGKSQFYVKFQGKKETQVMWVDGLFPYFSANKQPLFLSLDDQIWPMVLQKALCQYYNGYFEPAKVPIQQLIQTITGNQCYSLSLKIQKQNFSQKQKQNQCKQKLINTILKIQSRNCIMILKTNDECPLKAQEGRIESFSLLKVLGNYFLVNCPFLLNQTIVADVSLCKDNRILENLNLDSKQQKKEQKQRERLIRQMKLHQSHYQNPSCTTIWLDRVQFFNYFSQAIYCHPQNKQTQKSTTIKLTPHQNRCYLLIKTKPPQSSPHKAHHSHTDDKLYLTFKNRQSLTPIQPISCIGWQLIGTRRMHPHPHLYHSPHIEKLGCEVLGHVELSDVVGNSEVLVVCQFEDGNVDGDGVGGRDGDAGDNQSILMTCRGYQMVNVESMDSAIGDLEFIQCCKRYFKQNHEEYNAPIIQSIGDYLLLMAVNSQTCYIPLPISLTQSNIVQGIYIKNQQKVQMFQDDNIYFAVLSGVSQQVANMLKIMSYEKQVMRIQAVQEVEEVTEEQVSKDMGSNQLESEDMHTNQGEAETHCQDKDEVESKVQVFGKTMQYGHANQTQTGSQSQQFQSV